VRNQNVVTGRVYLAELDWLRRKKVGIRTILGFPPSSRFEPMFCIHRRAGSSTWVYKGQEDRAMRAPGEDHNKP